MPITAVLAVGQQLISFAQQVRTLSLSRHTVHVEDPDATNQARQWATQMNGQLVGLYGQSLVNAAAHEFCVRMKSIIDSGSRWGDYTVVRNAMSAYFGNLINSLDMTGSPINNQEVMLGALHGDAYWILRCMDASSDSEFILSTKADYLNALFPALKAQGADTTKLDLSTPGVNQSASGIAGKVAGFFAANKDVLLIVLAVVVVFVLSKVWKGRP